MMMKPILLLLTLLWSIPLFAQKVTGTIFDTESGLPVANARVTHQLTTVFSDIKGSFSLPQMNQGDTLTVFNMGYATLYFTLNNSGAPLLIYLKPVPLFLNEVNIKAFNKYRADSIKTRKEFSSVFAYKAPRLIDIFIPVSPGNRAPAIPGRSVNSTSSLVSLNLLPLLNLLGKNKNPTRKLQTRLLKGEEDNYVDKVFSKSKIVAVTSLKGDSLLTFMDAYRPSIDEARRMTDYEVLLYIKKQYNEFVKPVKEE